MAISENQFFELEKRILSFKYSLGVANMTSEKKVLNEKYAKDTAVYPTNILTEGDSIKFNASSGDNNIKPSLLRTWVTSSEGGLTDEQRLLRGHFSSSIPDEADGTNPHVEKIIMPLTSVGGTSGQAYITYNKESQSLADSTSNYQTEGAQFGSTTAGRFNKLAVSQSLILKNFVSPYKYGSGYKIKVFPSSQTDYTQPDTSVSILEAGNNDAESGEIYEGYIFDYTNGILLFAADGPETDSGGSGDGDLPITNGLFYHPLWIEAYRYKGPTGFSGPEVNITASNIEVEGNVNAQSYTLDSFSFIDSSTLSTSGSTVFGDNVTQDTHTFTGSVFITGSLEILNSESLINVTSSQALTASFAINAGQSGITRTLITDISASNLYIDSHSFFLNNGLTATDGNDILEYLVGGGIIISSSTGDPNLIALLGSESFVSNKFTKPNRSTNSTPFFNKINDSILNENDLFSFTTQSNIRVPDLSSYGSFKEHITASTTHSFSFEEPTCISKIGIYFSVDLNIPPQAPEYFDTIEKISISGSLTGDDSSYVPLYEEDNLNQKRADGIIPSKQYQLGVNPEFPNHGISEELGAGAQRYISYYTSSNFYTGSSDLTKFKHYIIHISGGYLGVEGDAHTENEYVNHIHHINLYKNHKFISGNRKQLSIKFDESPSITPGLNQFEFAISSAASNAGFQGIVEPDAALVVLGSASADLSLQNFDIKDATNIVTDNLFASNSIVSQNTLTVKGTSTFENLIKSEGSLYLHSGSTEFTVPSESIILKPQNPIYFTDFKSDGNKGVDEFSARIFGHYTAENVSDLYLDAYRIFPTADAEIRLTTLHPTSGSLVISSSNTLISSSIVRITGNVDTDGDLLASNLRLDEGGQIFIGGVEFDGGTGGSGFPHNQANTQITASIFGGLIISSSDTINNPFISLQPVVDANSITQNQSDEHILYNNNGDLFWGTTQLNVANEESTVFDNATLNNSKLGTIFDLNNQTITGSGNIRITGSLESPSITGSFSGSITGNIIGTASYIETAQSASYIKTAQSASYIETAQSASYVETAQTASYISSSNIDGAIIADSPFTPLSISGSWLGQNYQLSTGTASFTNIEAINISASSITGSNGKFDNILLNGNDLESQLQGTFWSLNDSSPQELTSSLSINISGNISTSGEIFLDNLQSIANFSNILRLGSNGYNKVEVDFGSPVFSVLSGGNVGIGDSDPEKKLVVSGDISSSGNLFIEGITDNSTTTFQTVVVDPNTGQLFKTGSYGGGSTTGAGFPFEGEASIIGSLEVTTNLPFESSDLIQTDDSNITTTLTGLIGDLHNSIDGSSGNGAVFNGTNNSQLNKHITYDLGAILGFNPIINRINIEFGTPANVYNHKQVEILGSNDNSTFTSLGLETLQSDGILERDFTFNNFISYKYYRLKFNEHFEQDQNAFLKITEVQFFPNNATTTITPNTLDTTIISSSEISSLTISSSEINVGGTTFTAESLGADTSFTGDSISGSWEGQNFQLNSGTASFTDITSSGNVNVTGEITASNLSLSGIGDVSASLAAAIAGGDDLGNHTATQLLNLNHNTISRFNNLLGGTLGSANQILNVNGSNFIIGDGTGYTNLNIGHSKQKLQILNSQPTITNSLTASNDISASGNLFADLPKRNLNTIVTYDTSSGLLQHYDISDFNINDSDSLSVSSIDEPYSCSIKQIIVKRDSGDICTTNPGSTLGNDCTTNSSSIVDGQSFSTSFPTAINPGETFIVNVSSSLNSQTKQKAANIIFDFETPTIVSQFKQTFEYDLGQGFYLPHAVFVYGSNTPFTGGEDEGTLLGTGAKPNNAIGDSSDWNAPIGLTGGEYFLGPYKTPNLNRITTIPETSLTSSFRYYRLRYSGSYHGITINYNDPENFITETTPTSKTHSIHINEITPVTRSFTQGSTIGFNNGIISTNQVITNYVDGTASYAIYAEEAGIASNGFPFNGNAVISGSLGVSGATNLNNLILDGNLNSNNYSIENINNVNAISINTGYLESNNITTNTLDTNILTIGTLPTSTPEISNGINTTGPISITTIIPSNITESYTTEPEILSVQKRQGLTGVYWDNLFGPGGKLKLSSSNFAFTSGSTSSLNDNNTNTSIIVNQNTLGTYYIPTPGEGPYPLYPLSTNDLAVEVHQTNSFFIKYKFPEPVLLEEFRINFVGEKESLIYSEETMSLDPKRLNWGPAQYWTANTGGLFIDDAPMEHATTPVPVIAGGQTLEGWAIVLDGNDNFFHPNEVYPITGTPQLQNYVTIDGLDSSTINNWGGPNLEDHFQDMFISYDFGEGFETIITRYQFAAIRGVLGNVSNQNKMFFEASNDGINFDILDETGNFDQLELAIELGSIWSSDIGSNYYGDEPTFFYDDNGDPIFGISDSENFNGNGSGIDYDRGPNHFTNNTAYRYYRFRLPNLWNGGDKLIQKIAFFSASVEETGTTLFNPEYISIYSNQEGEGDQGTDTIYAPFAYYPGTFKETHTVPSNVSNITTSIAQFNIDNQHPLSQYYTIEISGSHNVNNLVGISEITPVTRSFTTESITIGTLPPSPTPPTGYPIPTGPNIYWPNLPEGHPEGIDCSNANTVYYDESTGTFYHTSSCGSTSDTTTTTIFDTIQVDKIKEKTTSNGILIDSSIKINPSTISDNNKKRHLLTFDETTGEIFKAKNSFDSNTQTELDGDIQIKGDMSLTGSFDAHRAIIGISGSERRAFNDGKLDDFFRNAELEKEKFSLYVRNGATIVGGDIIPDTPLKYSLGNDKFQFKDLHIEKGSIHFYSGSSETSGSSKEEIGKIGINEITKEIEFKSGSEFINVKANQIKLGSSSQTTFTKEDLDNLKLGKVINDTSSDIQENDISVNVLKPDAIMSSIDSSTLTKLTTAGRVGQFVSGTLLFDQNLSNNNNYIAMGINNTQLRFTGDITSSGNISVSGTIIGSTYESNNEIRVFSGATYSPTQNLQTIIRDDLISLKQAGGSTLIKAEANSGFGDKTTAGIIQKGSGSFEILLDADSTQGSEPHFGIRSNTAIPGTLGTKLFTVSESFETRVHNGGLRADNYVTTTNITASGNISGSHITTASFGSLQLSNLPTSPTGLPTGSVWVSGSKNDSSTNNVNCGTLMIVI